MNVYEKLTEARIKFQEMGVKKSGQNKFAGYSYYELSDILPAINKIGKELKFVVVIYFGEEEVWNLDFIDSESGERITFSAPHSTAQLKGCHEVQNLGAVMTYIKRYLYQNAFEIVEADALDMTMNPNDQKQPPRQQQPKQPPREMPTDYIVLNKKLSEKLGLVPEEKEILWGVAGKDLKEMYTLLTYIEKEGSNDAGIIAYEERKKGAMK